MLSGLITACIIILTFRDNARTKEVAALNKRIERLENKETD